MKPDPPVRKDGLCFECRGPRTVPKNRQRGIDPAVYMADPFCSQLCARAFHDNPLPSFLGAALYSAETRETERTAA